MIAQVRGKLVAKDLDRVEILTAAGTGYELAVPLSVYETLPKVGEDTSLHTHLVVREDAWQLFGFATVVEKRVFQRLLTASGIGPALALGMLSTLSADRLGEPLHDRQHPHDLFMELSALYERLISQDEVDLIMGPYATPNIVAAQAVAERVKENFAGGVRAGIVTTPTLFLDGRRYSGRTAIDLLTYTS